MKATLPTHGTIYLFHFHKYFNCNATPHRSRAPQLRANTWDREHCSSCVSHVFFFCFRPERRIELNWFFKLQWLIDSRTGLKWLNWLLKLGLRARQPQAPDPADMPKTPPPPTPKEVAAQGAHGISRSEFLDGKYRFKILLVFTT